IENAYREAAVAQRQGSRIVFVQKLLQGRYESFVSEIGEFVHQQNVLFPLSTLTLWFSKEWGKRLKTICYGGASFPVDFRLAPVEIKSAVGPGLSIYTVRSVIVRLPGI